MDFSAFFEVDTLIVLVGFFGLIVGSITDFQRREVPDWISYFMIISGIGLRFIYSLTTGEWLFFGYGMLGFGVMLGIAYLMFYTGQWGGGDSKVLIGMGALFGSYPFSLSSFFTPKLLGLPFLVSFWINLLLLGAVYGILWTIVLGLMYFPRMAKAFHEIGLRKQVRMIRNICLAVAGMLFAASFFMSLFVLKVGLLIVSGIILVFFYMYMLVRSVEKSCMFKHVTPDKLVEGDWPVDDIVIDGKLLFPKAKTLGFEIKDIDKLKELHAKKKIDKIMIKNGVPFVPSFLMSLIVTITYGNLVSLMIF